MLRIHIALLFCLVMASEAFTQQDPKFNQYMFNPLGINPAYAGSRDAISTVFLYRNQWVGFDGAPTTQTFAIHGPIRNKRMGLGFQITNDAIGPRNTISTEVDYAYRLPLMRGHLSFGLGLGFQYLTFDWNKIDYKQSGDPIPTGGLTSIWVPDADFGVFYHTNKFYVGLELAHLTEPRITVSDSAVTSANAYRQFRHYSLTVGRAFVLNEKLTLRPSVLYKQAGLYAGMADVNVSLLIDKKFWAGVTYRSGYGGVMILEYIINRTVRIGYSFDYPFNDLRLSQGTSHEVFLGLEFGLPKQASSPRYF